MRELKNEGGRVSLASERAALRAAFGRPPCTTDYQNVSEKTVVKKACTREHCIR